MFRVTCIAAALTALLPFAAQAAMLMPDGTPVSSGNIFSWSDPGGDPCTGTGVEVCTASGFVEAMVVRGVYSEAVAEILLQKFNEDDFVDVLVCEGHHFNDMSGAQGLHGPTKAAFEGCIEGRRFQTYDVPRDLFEYLHWFPAVCNNFGAGEEFPLLTIGQTGKSTPTIYTIGAGTTTVVNMTNVFLATFSGSGSNQTVNEGDVFTLELAKINSTELTFNFKFTKVTEVVPDIEVTPAPVPLPAGALLLLTGLGGLTLLARRRHSHRS